MPEYFEISLISRKGTPSKSYTMSWLNQLGLYEGENTIDIFTGTQVLVSFYEDEQEDFEEVCIGLADYTFKKDSFYTGLQPITKLVESCFKLNQDMIYALCSYEINAYLMSNVKKLNDFSDELLALFPIVYKRSETKAVEVTINLKAQLLFYL